MSLVVLFLVIADMVIKPTGDDVGVLIGMTMIALAGGAYIVMSLRSIDEREQPLPASAQRNAARSGGLTPTLLTGPAGRTTALKVTRPVRTW
jgi:hypothetical protein